MAEFVRKEEEKETAELPKDPPPSLVKAEARLNTFTGKKFRDESVTKETIRFQEVLQRFHFQRGQVPAEGLARVRPGQTAAAGTEWLQEGFQREHGSLQRRRRERPQKAGHLRRT